MNDTIAFYVTFLRHGESTGNAEERFQGHADFPLSDKGRAQVEALADRWVNEKVMFDYCIASPLLRACQTAEIISARLNMPMELDADWMEINNGILAGMTPEEAEQIGSPPAFLTPYTRYGKSGESRWEVYLRAARGIQHILDRKPARYLVTAHAGVLNMAMYAILGIPVQANPAGARFLFLNTTFAAFRYEPEHNNWRLLHFDDRRHWKEEPSE